MTTALWAILWAQARARRNYFLRAHRVDSVLRIIHRVLWYGLWVGLAATAGTMVSIGWNTPPLLGGALLLLTLFWQLFPLSMASGGAFVDLRRLRAYPIPEAAFFWLEVALRLTTIWEAGILWAGITIGALVSGLYWAWLPMGLFFVFQLLLSSAIKTVIERLMKRRGLAEILILGLLLVTQLPHLVMSGAVPAPARAVVTAFEAAIDWLPHAAAARWAAGAGGWTAPPLLLAWVGAVYLFARLQFARHFHAPEADAPAAPAATPAAAVTWREQLYTWPRRLWRDPVAAIIEKDLRVLSRAPRFRLLFAMACFMGQLLWMPIGTRQGWVSENHLMLSLLYSQLVLGDLLLWNVFGFERGGAQAWFVMPLSPRPVLRAKNIVAAIAMAACWAVITAIVLALPVALTAVKWFEAVTASTVVLLFLLGLGNLASVSSPRAIDLSQSWRNATRGRAQLLLVLLYPLAGLPVALAYLARWATGAEWTFFATMAVNLLLAAVFYAVATEEAEERLTGRREQMVAALLESARSGPIANG